MARQQLQHLPRKQVQTAVGAGAEVECQQGAARVIEVKAGQQQQQLVMMLMVMQQQQQRQQQARAGSAAEHPAAVAAAAARAEVPRQSLQMRQQQQQHQQRQWRQQQQQLVCEDLHAAQLAKSSLGKSTHPALSLASITTQS
jgi:hypothetical protein